MANSKLKSVYNILKDFNFDSETAVNSDFLCTICNKIMIDAHFAPCGCRYCSECITAYLHGESKHCPGDTDDCNIDLINIDNNILIDHPMNIRISRLIVKCPERECDKRVELRKLENHFRVCSWKRKKDCPFVNIDCRSAQMSNDTIENQTRQRLLMETFDVLRSDCGDVKDEMTGSREEVQGTRLVIDDLRTLITQQSREIDRLGEEMVAVGNANREMQDKIKCLNTKLESYEDLNSVVRNNEEKQMREMDKMTQKVNCAELEIYVLRTSLQAMATLQVQLNYGEFVWQIEKFSAKRRAAQFSIDKQIFSDAFFSHKNGYKMCLSVYPNGAGVSRGTHLSVFICVMRGPFDNILEWPIKCDVTFSVINQQYQHSTDILKYEDVINSNNWKKPITERNVGCGFYNFMDLRDLLSNNPSRCIDRIFVKCAVNIF